MDKIINITVRNRIAIADPGQYIICGNEDYTAVFDFDAEWSGIDIKTARFSRKGIYTDVVFTGNTVEIPEMQNVSRVEIGVFAGDITTTPAVVRCHRSILCGGGNVHEPEPDVYAQIIKMIEEIEPGSGSGGSGEDGGYYVPTVTQVNENTIQISFAASRGGMEKVNAQTITLPSGEDGSPGENGKDGTSVIVVNVIESTEDGGSNVITFSDGHTLTVKNGSKGTDGSQGEQGIPGEKGDKGEKGDTGADGATGESGYTPVKGKDYWTDGDRAEIRDELGFSESNVLGLENGGTNATTAAKACENIGAVKKSGDTMAGALSSDGYLAAGLGQTYHGRMQGAADNVSFTMRDSNVAIVNALTMYVTHILARKSFVAPELTINRTDNDYPTLHFKSKSREVGSAFIQTEVQGTFGFYSYNRDQDNNATRYYDGYKLPSPDSNKTTNKNYDILTSKNPVTIAQGGHGATTAAGAVANLWVEIAKKIEATYNVTKK